MYGVILEDADAMDDQPPWDIRERAFRFACDIVRFCLNFGKKPGCRRIADQLLDAGTSVGANSEEAKSAYSRREFAVKNCIALKKLASPHSGCGSSSRAISLPIPKPGDF